MTLHFPSVPETPVSFGDQLAAAIATPRALLEALTELFQNTETVLSLEASALFLLGAAAVAAGGRVMLAVMALTFLANLSITLAVIDTPPTWMMPALTIGLGIAFVHMVLAILLTDQSAGTVLVFGIGALISLLLFKPLALLRVPGASRLVRLVRRH